MNLTSSVALNLNCAQIVKLYKKNYNHFVQGIFCHFFSKLNLVHNVIVRNCSKSLYCDDELEHFDILLNKTSFRWIWIMQLTHSQQQDTMALPQSPATNHQKITSQDLQVGISFCLCHHFLNICTFLVQQGLENKMDQDFLQLIIKAMRLPCSMQLMLTYITNPDLKPHKWAEEVCPETKPVTAVKADLNPVLAVISVAAAAATAVVVSISVGPVVRLNNFITVKFVKFLAPVSKKNFWYSPTSKLYPFTSAGPQTYKDHLDGQKHKKKEAAVRTGLPMVILPPSRTWKISINSRVLFN